MPQDERDILEVLRAELDFIEKGGYGRSVRTPEKPTSIFQGSLTCLNFGYQEVEAERASEPPRIDRAVDSGCVAGHSASATTAGGSIWKRSNVPHPSRMPVTRSTRTR